MEAKPKLRWEREHDRQGGGLATTATVFYFDGARDILARAGFGVKPKGEAGNRKHRGVVAVDRLTA